MTPVNVSRPRTSNLARTLVPTGSATPLPQTPESARPGESPAASPPVRDWGIIIFKAAGHGLSQDIKKGLSNLEKAGTSKSAYITVRAEQDGHYTDYSVTDTALQGPHLAPVKGGAANQASDKSPVLSRAAMQSFLTDTMKQYPARHYMISYESHGKLLRAALPDMHEAIAAASQQAGHKIDVLVLDACFMAQIESASAFQDVAGTLVASQEAEDGWRNAEELSQAVDQAPMDARQVGEHLVQKQTDFTLSAFDLSRVPQVNGKIKPFGEAIMQVKDQRGLAEIRRAIKQSQHFYTLGVTTPNPFHNTVDISDFVSHVSANKYLAGRHPGLISAARELQGVLGVGKDQFVFAENHVGTMTRTPEMDYYDVRNAHGVSMYLPTAPRSIRDVYTYFPNSQFNRETQWDGVVDHITSSRSPKYLAEAAAEDADGAALAGLNLVLNELVDWKKDHEGKTPDVHKFFKKHYTPRPPRDAGI